MTEAAPTDLRDYADQVVTYVRRALGITLEYDSNTLPVLDHYLATVRDALPEARDLVIVTAGAYFGETVRRLLGGRWEATPAADGSPDGPARNADWRMVLPTGLSFSPTGIVASAIAQAEIEDMETELDAPLRMRPYVQQALSRMGIVTVDDYYSLCGRLDTIEHVHEVLVAVAAQMMGDAADPDDEEQSEANAPGAHDAHGAHDPADAMDPIDEPPGGVN